MKNRTQGKGKAPAQGLAQGLAQDLTPKPNTNTSLPPASPSLKEAKEILQEFLTTAPPRIKAAWELVSKSTSITGKDLSK